MTSIYTEADTSQCSLTEDESGGDTLRKTGFLQLPLELRQKVYRELLGERPCPTDKFQTNILCVSKEIHDEALEVFYEENGFIMYHVHRNVLGQLRPNPQNDRDFFSAFAFHPVTGADGRIGFEPALTVSIALQHSCFSVPDSRWQDEWERYVGFPGTLPSFCLTLTMCQIRNTLHLRLSLPSMEYRKLVGRPDRLLDYFQECRGVSTAEILAAGDLPVENDLSSLMAKPLERFDEILTRGRCYQDRVRQQLACQQRFEAWITLSRAEYFFDWWAFHGFELSNETDKKWTEFWDMRLETSLAYAFQSIQQGEPKKARAVTRRMFHTVPLKREPGSTDFPRRLWDRESEVHYTNGLAFLAEGHPIAALYSFLQALISKPGHGGVDKEIDELQATVENSDEPHDEIVRWNIKHVLKDFRHQPPLEPNLDDDKCQGPIGMTADEVSRHIGSFILPVICRMGTERIGHPSELQGYWLVGS